MARRPRPGRMDLGTYRREDATATPSIDDEIDEGMLLARYSVRMAMKNVIIVTALRGGSRFDAEEFHAPTRQRLEALARENDGHASRMAQLRERAGGQFGRARHEHDYRSADVDVLERRERIYAGLAARLREAADEHDYRAELVEGARADAWKDVGSFLEATLHDPYAGATRDADYEYERTERLERLVSIDIAALLGETAVAPQEEIPPRRRWRRLLRRAVRRD